MEHLENDMDDLFQKAGELYPLKTTGSDWDAVAGKLLNENPGEVHDLSGPAAVSTRRRRWLLLLLLIPLGLGIFYFSGYQSPGHQNIVSAKPLNPATDQNKINALPPDSQPISDQARDNKKSTASDNIQGLSRKKKTSETGSANGILSGKNKRLTYAAGGKQGKTDSRLNSQKQISSDDGKSKTVLNSNNSNQGIKETETAVTDNSGDKASSSASESAAKAGIAAAPVVASTQSETATVKNKTDKTDSKNTLQDSSVAKKKQNTISKQSKGFYVGLIGGPDVSTVKFQSVHNLGFSIGGLVGYRFNNHISVETGILWDKKYYYASGEYFSKDQLQIPSSVDILNVNGNCNMFEIPLSFRYDFAAQKKHNFFAAAGLSSYLMTSEYYSFQLQGSYGTYTKDSLYNSSNTNILSIAKLSVGYEYMLNSKTKIRFEPYVNIPLQGVGLGSMSISSVGLYLGITHSFR